MDPGADRLDTPPKVVKTIKIPGGGKGPHYVDEYGDLLWVSLKTSDQVLAINHKDPRKYRLYETKPDPIFVARHPGSGEFYVSQDQAGEILRINAKTNKTSRLKIPAARGTTPVGLVAGPAGLWVVLLGTKQGGTGTFGRIDSNGEITWFTLTSPEGRRAGLLHVAFDRPVAGQRPSAWLLSSSIISPNSLDAIIRVTFGRQLHTDQERGSRRLAHPAVQGTPRVATGQQRAGHGADQRDRRATCRRAGLSVGPAHDFRARGPELNWLFERCHQRGPRCTSVTAGFTSTR
ncbi:MAG: hypothetical protein ACRDRI_08285 [Pseudonocardiaceae bacterium]